MHFHWLQWGCSLLITYIFYVLTIKHLFNHHSCSIIPVETKVNLGSTPFQMGENGGIHMLKDELPHHHGGENRISGIRKQLDNIEDFQTIAEIFKQLGDTTRIRIFFLLCHCEECVINISAILNMSSPAVSHHLRPLRNSGLIVSRREGKEVYYRAADTPQSRLLHQMIEQVMEIACPK